MSAGAEPLNDVQGIFADIERLKKENALLETELKSLDETFDEKHPTLFESSRGEEEKSDSKVTDDTIFPVVAFPFEALPSNLREVIEEIGAALNIEPSVAASIAIAIISGAVGNSIRISVKSGYDIPVFIWLIVVASTGYGKSPAFQALMRPIIDLQTKAHVTYCSKIKQYAKLSKEAKEAGADVPYKPKLKHFYVSDCTVEALAGVFEGDGRGLVSHQDELAGLIFGLNQYKKGGNDRQHYLELFDCKSWKIDRATKDTKFIQNTGAALIGGIQPKVMPKVFTEECFDDGFIPRFLLHLTESKPLVFSRQGITPAAKEYWDSLIHKCYELELKHDDDGCIIPLSLPLSSDALNVWEKFYNNYGAKFPFLSERAKVFIPKLIGYYSLKFAGILWAISENRNLLFITEEIIEHAISLTHFYAGQSIQALKLYGVEDDRLSEFHKRLIQVLHLLSCEVKNGRLPLSRITEVYNNGFGGLNGLPIEIKINNKKIGSLIRDLGLKSKEGTGGVYYLLWEPILINNLFSKYNHLFSKNTSTMSTKSTETNFKNFYNISSHGDLYKKRFSETSVFSNLREGEL